MKRISILLLCLLLALSGCGAATGTEEAADSADNTAAAEAAAAAAADAAEAAADTTDTTDTADTTEATETTEAAETTETTDAEDADETETAAEPEDTAEGEPSVTVDVQTDDQTVTAEDGTELAQITTLSVTVSVEGDPEVEESINADLRQLAEDVSSSAQEFDETARADYDYALEEGLDWYAYASDLGVEVTRCDGQVLSLWFEGYQYYGGAHGSTYSYGRSYDLSSGSRLTLDHLSDQGVSFREYALEQITALAQTEEYADRLFEGIGKEDLEAVVTDTSFYFTDEAIVFAADPYVIASYAAGTIQFPLAYSDLEGTVRAEYLP